MGLHLLSDLEKVHLTLVSELIREDLFNLSVLSSLEQSKDSRSLHSNFSLALGLLGPQHG